MNEEFVYHRVPENMSGTILYPLNELKKTHPRLYSQHVAKYVGREHLLNVQIPPLNCLWNDVLHFTAVSPKKLKENLAKADTILPSVAWFEVPLTLITGPNTIVFKYRRDISPTPTFDEFEIFDPNNISLYRSVPDETIEYYKQKKAEGIRPLLFHLVPHILYKGTLDTTGLQILHS